MSYQQLLDELQTYEDEYRQYRELFESDGNIDSSEQAQLDRLESMIGDLRESLNANASEEDNGMCVDPLVPGLDGAGLSAENCYTDDPVQNPISERDWTTLKTDFVQAVQIWCNGMQHVVNNFEKDLKISDADSDNVALAKEVLKVVIGEILPENAKLALDIAEPILNRIISELQSGEITLRSFCETWDGKFDSFKSDARAHDEMFANFRKNVEKKCGSGLSLEAVSREISYLPNQLPQRDAVRKLLLKAWIESTEDEGAFIDEWGDIAGYFKVTIWREGRDQWNMKECYLDDTDEQAGVIAMLQKEYPNTALEKLPFLMRVFILHGLNLRETTLAEKAKNGGWSLKSGMQVVFDDWRKSGKSNPTTKDLAEESLL
jgi:hypothetical protein